MKGVTTWSYAPYRPFFYEVGEVYICRVVPYETAIHFEWLRTEKEKIYEIFVRMSEEEDFVPAGQTTEDFFDLSSLLPETDYEFYVRCGEKRSRTRLARTGASIGTTVNYLHPKDAAYAFSGRYLCSPSLVRHPEGYLLASMDLFAGNAPQNLSLIFRSDDDGETWHYVSELYPCFWGKLFIHKNDVYMLAVSTEYGDLLIGRSTDGGKTFGTPTVLLRGGCNNVIEGVHKCPQNIVHYRGRLYETLEWGAWKCGYHAAMVMSCEEDADLLCAENWHFSEPVKYDPSWPGVAEGRSCGTLEGTLAIAPDGTLYNLMRYDMAKAKPNYGRILAYRVNTEDPDAPLRYTRAIEFPANNSKFMIKKDDKTGKYFSLATRITDAAHISDRTILSLLVSDDLINWSLAYDVIDAREEDAQKIGFQYVDFEIEGDDILALIRTAMNGADSFHDANYSTFLRIRNFRNLEQHQKENVWKS